MADDQLDEQDVHALLASLEQAGSGAERRRHPRTTASGSIPAVIRRSGSGMVRGYVRDLSCSGAGVFTQTPVGLGEQVDVSIEPAGRATIRATCRVAACRVEASGRHIIGLEFVTIARGPAPAVPSNGATAQPARPPAPSAEATSPEEHLATVSNRLGTILAGKS